jgi:hypothetical protein
MNNLTKDYEMQILKLEDKIGDDQNVLMIEDLRDELNLRFERMNAKDDSDSNDKDEEEKALFGGGQFKGRCNNCGKYGHKSANCRSGSKGQKKTGSGKYNGTYKGDTSSFRGNHAKIKGNCWNCNKPGHRSADCRSTKKADGEQPYNANKNKKKEKHDENADVILLST